MQYLLAHITPRRGKLKSGPAQELLDEYVKRAGRFAPVEVKAFETEAALLGAVASGAARTSPVLMLLDSRGTSLTSEAFAAQLGRLGDAGTQRLTLAIGPADGWATVSPATRGPGVQFLSLGAMTLPHELALVVLAEQVYRALTILAGHPYHGGHA